MLSSPAVISIPFSKATLNIFLTPNPWVMIVNNYNQLALKGSKEFQPEDERTIFIYKVI